MKAICPACGQLVSIEPTGKPIGQTGSATWKRVAAHELNMVSIDPAYKPGGIIVVVQCEGTGRLV